jgi:copper homeostasis protein
LDSFLEIACFNIPSAKLAEKAGADRIEFCADYAAGGITPSMDDIELLKKSLSIPLHVIIRPRGGNFVYTSEELLLMKEQIQHCKKNNINGVIFGVLTRNGEIDKPLCAELLDLAKPMTCVFHRAIDEVKPIEKNIEQLIELGFDSILTSGGETNALAGKQQLAKLQTKFGHHIHIIAGGGIRSSNIAEIRLASQCEFFHSAALINNQELVDENEIKKMRTALA